jgi:hypothetical protein
MRVLIALLVIAYLVGVGVALAPTIKSNWSTGPASQFVESVATELPRALSWSAMPDAYVIEVFGRTAGSHVAQSGGHAMGTFDFAPLYRGTVGFDRVFSMLDHSAVWNDGSSAARQKSTIWSRAGSGSCGSSKAAFRNRRFPGLPELPRVPARRFAKSAAAVWIAFINVLA